MNKVIHASDKKTVQSILFRSIFSAWNPVSLHTIHKQHDSSIRFNFRMFKGDWTQQLLVCLQKVFNKQLGIIIECIKTVVVWSHISWRRSHISFPKAPVSLTHTHVYSDSVCASTRPAKVITRNISKTRITRATTLLESPVHSAGSITGMPTRKPN